MLRIQQRRELPHWVRYRTDSKDIRTTHRAVNSIDAHESIPLPSVSCAKAFRMKGSPESITRQYGRTRDRRAGEFMILDVLEDRCRRSVRPCPSTFCEVDYIVLQVHPPMTAKQKDPFILHSTLFYIGFYTKTERGRRNNWRKIFTIAMRRGSWAREVHLRQAALRTCDELSETTEAVVCAGTIP